MLPGSYSYGQCAGELERLDAVERALDSPTRSLLRQLGVGEGWRCWEVGAGRGSIARWLGELVGNEGHVLATDLDGSLYSGASHVAFRIHDLSREAPPARDFDLVHARLVLEHLTDPAAALYRLISALRPGGVILIEDSAGLRIDCMPQSSLFERLAPAWERAGLTVGWDAAYGRQLPRELRSAGAGELGGREFRVIAPGGEGCSHLSAGLDRLRDALLGQGISESELEQVQERLRDSETVITGPPIVSAWGRAA